MRLIDMVGQQFGRLTVRRMLKGSRCESDCACGVTGFVTDSYSIRKGQTTSCGCYVKQLLASASIQRKHGESPRGHWTAEYRAWVNMKTRCGNPRATRFKHWGGRGIKVCPEWMDNYEAFVAYVGRRPSPRHSLDRYPNPDGDYKPGNVRWATFEEQAQNKRKRAA